MCQFLTLFFFSISTTLVDSRFVASVAIIAFTVVFGIVWIGRRWHVFDVIVHVVVQLAMNPQGVPRYSTVQVGADSRRRPARATGSCRRRCSSWCGRYGRGSWTGWTWTVASTASAASPGRNVTTLVLLLLLLSCMFRVVSIQLLTQEHLLLSHLFKFLLGFGNFLYHSVVLNHFLHASFADGFWQRVGRGDLYWQIIVDFLFQFMFFSFRAVNKDDRTMYLGAQPAQKSGDARFL